MMQSEINRLIDSSATLNGKQAVICGRLNPFAVVRALDGSISAEFSWQAVSRIIEKGGNFHA